MSKDTRTSGHYSISSLSFQDTRTIGHRDTETPRYQDPIADLSGVDTRSVTLFGLTRFPGLGGRGGGDPWDGLDDGGGGYDGGCYDGGAVVLRST